MRLPMGLVYPLPARGMRGRRELPSMLRGRLACPRVGHTFVPEVRVVCRARRQRAAVVSRVVGLGGGDFQVHVRDAELCPPGGTLVRALGPLRLASAFIGGSRPLVLATGRGLQQFLRNIWPSEKLLDSFLLSYIKNT